MKFTIRKYKSKLDKTIYTVQQHMTCADFTKILDRLIDGPYMCKIVETSVDKTELYYVRFDHIRGDVFKLDGNQYKFKYSSDITSLEIATQVCELQHKQVCDMRTQNIPLEIKIINT